MSEFREYLIFERSRPGKLGCTLPPWEEPSDSLSHTLGDLVREELTPFPEVSEVEVTRHFTRLSQWNFGVDQGMYPLGSCTMKYNPALNEWAAGQPGFTSLHPLSDDQDAQGTLQALETLSQALCEVSGLASCSLHPAAGAQGEMTGLLAIAACLKARGEQRKFVLVPDSAHGTNPATATLAGFQVVEVPSDASGRVDLAALASLITHETAAMMVTNPNTLGIFESDIHKISDMLHEVGAFLYMDGANLNALVGKARPGDMGVDVMHINLHKTFSTPHGGGGPGSGPVCAVEELAPFLPGPHLGRNDQGLLQWQEAPSAFGRVHSFFGHPGVALRALSWILTLGPEGLRQHTEHAVLNNNYLRSKLKTLLHLPFEAPTLHETVFSDKDLHDCGVTTMDLAKALLDRGFHPPTVYFPLVVPGALMVEPTETESRGELDRFVAAIESIVRQAEVDPESVKAAPERTPFGRMDETRAARQPVLKWQPNS